MENELSNLESEVDKLKSLLSDDLANIIKDFLKAFRGDLLFNADKQLKHLESELAKLENRLREVNGDNEDFMTLLTKANNDPSDKARVELIALLLDESENDAKKQLKKIKSDKDKMKILLENMRNELRSQNAADVSVATINDILKDSATTAEMIGMRLIELESIYDDIQERRKRWADFDAESGEKLNLINQFGELFISLSEEYRKMCEGVLDYSDWNDGFTLINKGMKNHPDYEAKQEAVGHNENKQAQLRKGWNIHETNRETYGQNIDAIKQYGNDEYLLKNMAIGKLITLLDQVKTLEANLKSSNIELDETNKNFSKDRANLGDIELYELSEQKNDELGKLDSHMTEMSNIMVEIEKQLQNASEHSPNVQEIASELEIHNEAVPQYEQAMIELS